MTDFVFGVIASCFGILALVQLLAQKTITFEGYVDKAQNPERYWTVTLAYAAGCAGALLIIF